jgi:NADPH:quinone reductase-like Zn-dependent oxidoreductase
LQEASLVHGAAGNVGAYAVQLTKNVGAEIIGAVLSRDVDYVSSLGTDKVIDVQTVRFEKKGKDVDVVIDTIGGETLDRSFDVLKPGGTLVSSANHGKIVLSVSDDRLRQLLGK